MAGDASLPEAVPKESDPQAERPEATMQERAVMATRFHADGSAVAEPTESTAAASTEPGQAAPSPAGPGEFDLLKVIGKP